MSKKYLSVKQYATRHKISRQAVHKRIKAGKLKAEKVGKIYIIKK